MTTCIGVRFDMLDAKQKLYCVWTGKALRRNSLDIDHCFPLVGVAVRRSMEPHAFEPRG